MEKPFPAYRGDQPYLFVCYAHADAAHVYPELKWLRQQQLNIWYDEGISGGKIWRAEIGNAIKGAHKVLFYISSASLKSDHCSRELNFALDQRKEIIPVYLEDVELTTDLQVGLSRVQALHRDGRYKSHLLNALQPKATIEIADSLRTPEQPRRSAKSLLYGLVATVAAGTGLLWLSIDNSSSNDGAAASPITLIVRPFSDNLDTSTGLEYELQRRLLTSPGLAVRVSAEPAVDADYVLNGQTLGNVLSLSLEDKDGQTTKLPSIDLTENLETMATALSQDVLTHLGRPTDTGVLNSDIQPAAFRQYLSATAILRSGSLLESLNNAVAGYQEVLNLEPRFAPAHSGLCSTYLKIYSQNQDVEYFELAEQHCHRALTLDEHDSNVHVALAMLYRESGQFSKAIDRYHQALKISAYSTDAMRGLGITLMRTGVEEEAESLLNQALTLEPNYWENYEALGILQFQTGRYEQAAETFQAAHALAPDETGIANNIGAAFYLAGNFNRAIEFWEQAVAAGPSVVTYSNLGSAFFFLRDFDAAFDMYVKAKDLAPTDHRLWGHIGDVLLASGNANPTLYFQEAVQLAKQQLIINPKDASTIANLGAYYAALGDPERANEQIRLASGLEPKNIDVAYDRAITLARLGDAEATDQALAALQALGYSRELIEKDSNFDVVNNKTANNQGADSD
jgi:Flp pilus assembly protein TadD